MSPNQREEVLKLVSEDEPPNEGRRHQLQLQKTFPSCAVFGKRKILPVLIQNYDASARL